MERITYLLGAGFSAPLGLPVMSNFIAKSKELYFDNPEKYKHFKVVMDTIHDMAYIKNFCKVDLSNIEEILSLLEMSNYVSNKSIKEEFVEYIKDVIKGYTRISDFAINDNKGSFYGDNTLFNGDKKIELYAYFLANIFRMKFGDNGHNWFYDNQFNDDPTNTRYSIITLNYDMVLESILENICKYINKPNLLNFVKDYYYDDWAQPHLEKLHGCAENGGIVPPTWAKGTNNTESIRKIWNNSYEILKDSTQIRIIGYSLPLSDAYIKYLIKTSIIQNDRLKRIDVITLDETDEIRKRYDDFFEASKYRFKHSDIEKYLQKLRSYYNGSSGNELRMDKLEDAHDDFMKSEIGNFQII